MTNQNFHFIFLLQANVIIIILWAVSILFSAFPLIGWSRYVSEVKLKKLLAFKRFAINLLVFNWLSRVTYDILILSFKSTHIDVCRHVFTYDARIHDKYFLKVAICCPLINFSSN